MNWLCFEVNFRITLPFRLIAFLNFLCAGGDHQTASAIVQLGSLTGDHLRDIDQEVRQKAIARLSAAGISDDLSRGLQQYVPPAQADAMRIFGESLPEGLRLVG